MRLLRPEHPPPTDSEEHRRRIGDVGRRLRAANVRAVYLLHGTFVGTDALGILSDLSRVWPAAADLVRGWQKHWLDAVAGDAGNYTAEFASKLETGFGESGASTIPVRLFNWSSENNHIGRAQAAVDLFAELNSTAESMIGDKGGDESFGANTFHRDSAAGTDSPPRVLLWGHSHGGNVLALLTNLLGASEPERRRFFHAARSHYRWPLFGCCDLPVWPRVQRLLERNDAPIRRLRLDVATFGTPVRYGWDSDAYGRLMHFVFHRPAEGVPEWRTVFPPTAEDVLAARHGDYIQQWGIAGTNLAPGVLSWRTLLADFRLNRLLQRGMKRRRLLERLRLGQRVPDEGETLLVDYGLPTEHIGHHFAGHAVYTRREWMLFHAEEVARRFYPGDA